MAKGGLRRLKYSSPPCGRVSTSKKEKLRESLCSMPCGTATPKACSTLTEKLTNSSAPASWILKRASPLHQTLEILGSSLPIFRNRVRKPRHCQRKTSKWKSSADRRPSLRQN